MEALLKLVNGKGLRAKKWVHAVIVGEYKTRKEFLAAQKATTRTFGSGNSAHFEVSFSPLES